MKSKLFTVFVLVGMILFSSCVNNRSYAEEPKTKVIETDHYTLVRSYADQVAEQFMEKICPNTGKNSYGLVIEYYYDRYHDRYEIEMEAYWTGKTWALGDYEKFNIDGTLNVYHDGDWDFEVSYKNTAVRETIDNNELYGAAILTLGTLIVLSEYQE